jgi:hypothetical protein
MRLISHTVTHYKGPWSEPRPTAESRTGQAQLRMILPPLGLGEVVERIAKPIALEIDRVAADFGRVTRVAGCSACSKRRHFLNRVVPNVRSWRDWLAAWRRVRPAYRAVWGCRQGASSRA